MTQSEVYNLLKKTERWWSIKEVNEKFKYNSAQSNLSKLYQQNLIYKKEVRNDKGKLHFLFKIK